jgi:hypothetical protein
VYEVYLSQQIINAAEENKLEKVKALASIALHLKDFRELVGIPPANVEPNLGEPREKCMNAYEFKKWRILHDEEQSRKRSEALGKAWSKLYGKSE